MRAGSGPLVRRGIGRALVTAGTTLLAGALLSGGAWLGPRTLAAGTAAAPSRLPTSASAGVPGPVLLIGTSGVRWSDVTAGATPALWQLSRDAGVAVDSTRGVGATGCPVDGWLTVSAGARAAAPRDGGRCAELTAPVGGAVTGWAADLAAVRDQQVGAKPGTLGAVLDGAGVSTAALGPGAAVALAGTDGRVVGRYSALPSSAGDVTAAVRGALAAARLVVVDAGDGDPAAAGGERAARLTAVDATVGAALAATEPGTTVLVASLTDAGTPDLQLLAARGPAPAGGTYDGGMLTSGATRQHGVVQVTDVPATLLDALGLRDRASALVGATIERTPGPPTADARVSRLVDVQREALAITRGAGVLNTGIVVLEALFLVVGALLLRAGHVPGTAALRGLRVVGTALALLPVSTFLVGLVPWWRTDAPTVALCGVTLGWAVVLAVPALAGPWRRTVLGTAAAVATVTAAVLVTDAVLGSPLAVDSPMGEHRLLGARFYGWSNQAFALATTAGMLVAVVVADRLVRAGRRRAAVAAVAALGLLLVVVDGTPGLGSDAGGPVALLLAFGLFAVVVSGRRVRWRTVLLAGAAGVLVVGGLMVLDYLRPPAERTHLGRFVATLLQGGLWTVLARKESANLHVLGNWRYLALLLVGVAVAWVALVGRARRRGTRLRDGDLGGLAVPVPLLRPGLAAWGAAMAVGFLMNDSGIIVPATGIALVGPALVASAALLRADGADGLRAGRGRATPAG